MTTKTKQAYIISTDGYLIAPVETDLKGGFSVCYGWHLSEEIDGTQGTLINKLRGNISRDQKWGKRKHRDVLALRSSKALDLWEDEFLISDNS